MTNTTITNKNSNINNIKDNTTFELQPNYNMDKISIDHSTISSNKNIFSQHKAENIETILNYNNYGSCKSTTNYNLKIRMIDLAHTIHNNNGFIDFGYFHGLQSLINYLRLILDAASQNMELLNQGIIELLLIDTKSSGKSFL